jgi:RNA polymerase sigma factor (sigma-70 family)
MTESRQEKFETLLASHSGIVFRVMHAYCRQPEDRQDLAQEIKLQLWSAFPKYDERRTFSTWMYRIALNVAISWTRQASARIRPTVALDDIEARAVAPEPNEDVQTLYRLIDELDSMNRALLLLFLDDLSYAEIGEVLGITPSNVATKVSRLKDRLRLQALSQDNSTQ